VVSTETSNKMVCITVRYIIYYRSVGILERKCYIKPAVAALCYASNTIVCGLNVVPVIAMALATKNKSIVAGGRILTSGSSCRENICGIYLCNNQSS